MSHYYECQQAAKQRRQLAMQDILQEHEIVETENTSTQSQQSWHTLNRSAANLIIETKEMREKITMLEETNGKLQAQLQASNERNYRLQNEVIEVLKTLSNSKMIEQAEQEPPLHFCKENKVYLGNNIWITSTQYNSAKMAITPSQYVRNLSVAVWGNATLENSSVDGKPCNRFHGVPSKPPLSPQKVNSIRESLVTWLHEKGIPDDRISKKTKKFIGDKIQDLKKSYNKNRGVMSEETQ